MSETHGRGAAGDWSDWLPFPDPEAEGVLVAPIGPGVYELRNRATGEHVLVGVSKNCAFRMTSLLPPPLGQGTRDNATKSEYVGQHMASIDYRTRACATDTQAHAFERELLDSTEYLFRT